jgi:hypothetical protein
MRMGSIYTIDWNPFLQFFVPLLLIAGLTYYFFRRPAGSRPEPPVRAAPPREPEPKVTKTETFDL